jgi:DNA-directed RNA polymerase subunit RPC12/RpoP
VTVSAIQCPHCGAPVTVPTGAHSATCQHCARTTQIAIATATARDDLVERQQVEAEARNALAFQTLRLARLRAIDIALVVCIVVASPSLIAAFAQNYGLQLDTPFSSLAHVASVVFGAAGLTAGAATWLLLRRNSAVYARANGQLERLTRETRRHVRGTCPHCGAPLSLDGTDATPHCQHCGTQLWVAFGRLIAWSADAKERAQRWSDVARETYFRVELPAYRIWFMPVLAFCALYALISSLWALAQEIL